jgi:hypothetical protein
MTIINLNFILGQTERDLNDLSQFVMQMKILKREKVNFTDSHLQGKLRPFTLVKNFFLRFANCHRHDAKTFFVQTWSGCEFPFFDRVEKF